MLIIPATATSSQRAPRELPELPTMKMINGENLGTFQSDDHNDGDK